MRAEALLEEGRLTDALEAATAAVRGAPTDVHARILLAELLAAAGEWGRADKQLAVVADQAPEMAEGVASYRGLLTAEAARAQLFADGVGAPQQMSDLPLDPEPQLTVLRLLREGDADSARAVLAEGGGTPPRPAVVDDAPVDVLQDADDVLAPFLEVMADGRYGWLPLAQLAQVEFEPVRTFRDLLWRPARVTLIDGASATLFVPSRYPLSERAEDPAVRLARATDWRDRGGIVTGVGQRAFLAGDDLRYVLDVTTLAWPEPVAMDGDEPS